VTFIDQAANDPDGIALDDGTRRRTWQDLLDRATAIGNLLRNDLGIPAGGHAGLLMDNRVDFIECVLGAQLAGVWITPVNWHLTAPESSMM
jgi:long-chain acyl-CoA synthetase